MIGEEGKWRKVTVAEAREVEDNLIFWRPNMLMASLEKPDDDPAYILEEIKELPKLKRVK